MTAQATDTITTEQPGTVWLNVGGVKYGPFESSQEALAALLMAQLPTPISTPSRACSGWTKPRRPTR